MEKKANVLLLDIETSPLVCYTWGVREVDAIAVIKPWHLLSIAYKWLGEEKVHCIGNIDFGDPLDDRPLCRRILKLLDRSDIVIAQNGDAFDIPKINTRLLINGMRPPSPFKTIDTLKLARAHFAFSSNRLDALGKDMSEGQKINHRGFEMWEKCLRGDRRAWADMKAYNIQDVVLLEKIYLRLRAWSTRHPNMSVYKNKPSCRICGEEKLNARGTRIANNRPYTRYWCRGCKAWSRSSKSLGTSPEIV